MQQPDGIGVEVGTPGHLFVADTGNARVVELNAWGKVERAWGWEVVSSGPGDDNAVNEAQNLFVSATAGTYRLEYFDAYVGNFDEVTTPLPFDAPASAVREALENLASLQPGDIAVSGGPGSPSGTNPYEIEFMGSYSDTAVPELIPTGVALSGGSGAAVQTVSDGGSFEVCVPDAGDVCKKGQSGGSAPGQFGGPSTVLSGGVSVDNNGDVYIFESVAGNRGEEKNFRVQKFDNNGTFLLMWGGKVNKTTDANRCTKSQLESGDVCGAGVPGTEEGQFAGIGAGATGNKIAVNLAGTVLVGDKGRIQEFDQDGHYLGSVESQDLEGQTVKAMTVDDVGDLYVAYAGSNDVRKLNPAGDELESPKFKGRLPSAVAAGAGGRLYLVETPQLALGAPRILGYESNGTCFICPADEFRATSTTDPNGLATSTACEIPGEDLYSSFHSGVIGEAFLRAYGPAPNPTITGCEPPEVPPGIEDQFASSVSTDGAVLRATINPHFWSGPVIGPTTYYVQYATAACIEGGGWEAACVEEQPAPPGKTLKAEAIDANIAGEPIALTGLTPETAFRFRFVAQSPGGGPVFGKGGTEAVTGAEGAFTTFKLPPPPEPGCANDPFRTGPAALLPDCRAYEMVSPVDKEGGDVIALTDAGSNTAALNQSSNAGDKFTYSSFRAFSTPESAPISSQYVAIRDPDPEVGWQNDSISPPRGVNFLDIVLSLNNQFKAFSPDLCEAWIFHETEPPLIDDGINGFANLYQQATCGPSAGEYEVLTTSAPPNSNPAKYVPELQGISADGQTAIFRAPDKLTSDASDPGGKDLLYEAYGDGQLRFVCRREDESTADECVAGTASTTALRGYGREQAVSNAISGNGERIFWSESSSGPGPLYVRIGGTKTLQLSSGQAQYWSAAANGSAAIFTTGETTGENPSHLDKLKEGDATLHTYNVDAKVDMIVADGVYGVMGASEDASRIYFASKEVLDAGAVAGQPNLYFWEGGESSFIGVLSGEDAMAATVASSTLLNVDPDEHTAQITPQGLQATFMSTAPLTGHDSTDAQSGEADAEVFHYDAATDTLVCASCNPTGARPTGRDVNGTWAAARIPGAQTHVYQVPRVLSGDGRRLFFESFQPLVANDTNGKADVYQWEAPGKGGCSEASSLYRPDAGGCVALISTGQSPVDSTIADASPTGDDIFFATASSLVPQDPGLIDIYDARAGGGLPAPPEPKEPCEGTCQNPPPAPEPANPASSTYEGPGDLKEAPAVRRCPKGKRRVTTKAGKSRCVKRKRAQRKGKRQSAKRRAAR